MTMLAVVMGSSLISAVIAISAEMDQKVGKELRNYGSNLLVVPQNGDYLKEDSLLRLKTIFWRHNLVGIAPILKSRFKTADTKSKIDFIGTWFDRPLKTAEGKWDKTGARQTFPWWRVKGRWPRQENEVLVGSKLAKSPVLSRLSSIKDLKIVGILYNSEYESAVVGSTTLAQKLLGRPNVVEEVRISAMIVPGLKLPSAIQRKRVSEMSRKEYQVWYCTPTVGAISAQIKEVVPNAYVKNLRQFTEAEGRLLSQIELMIFLTIVFSLAATVLAVMTSTTVAVMERKGEIGLAKSIGASDSQIAFQFATELVIIALMGGIGGYFLGWGLSQFIGQAVFKVGVSFSLFTLATTLGLSLLMAFMGSIFPVIKATRVQPVVAMKG